MSIQSRKVSESMVQTVHMVRPNHLNGAGRLFGGILYSGLMRSQVLWQSVMPE